MCECFLDWTEVDGCVREGWAHGMREGDEVEYLSVEWGEESFSGQQ